LGPFFIEAFRYHKWANLHLLAACADLTPQQLQMTSPGTYGSMAATFLHLLGAEQRYIRRFSGAEVRISERDEFPGMAALRDIAERSADELIEIVGRAQPDDQLDTTYDEKRYLLQAGVVLLQALHHGNDHRTHICTILGAHDIPYGDMDVWAYGNATGSMVLVDAS
jgi:uncharacterized damage-inducible protein DinB